MPSSVLAFSRPRSARWLKPLSLRPPTSVTSPTLNFLVLVPPPVMLVAPHAVKSDSSMSNETPSERYLMRERVMRFPLSYDTVGHLWPSVAYVRGREQHYAAKIPPSASC